MKVVNCWRLFACICVFLTSVKVVIQVEGGGLKEIFASKIASYFTSEVLLSFTSNVIEVITHFRSMQGVKSCAQFILLY